MEALVFKGNAGQALTSSLLVAKKFGKEHKRVMQDVRELGCSEKFRQHNFVLSTYLSSQNKELPMYIITKDPLELPVPVYAKSKGIIHSATEILNERNIPLSAQKFYKIMIQAGMLERASIEKHSLHIMMISLTIC